MFLLFKQLYFDNFYTDVQTVVALKERKTYCTGTLRAQKPFLPKPLLVTSESSVRALHFNFLQNFVTKFYIHFIQYKGAPFFRGDCVFAFSIPEEITFLNWLDTKHVLMLCALLYLTIEMSECQRSSYNEKKQHEVITYPQPAIVEKYCKKMFFVDRGYSLLLLNHITRVGLLLFSL